MQSVPEKEMSLREIDGYRIWRLLERKLRALQYGQGASSPHELRGQRQEEFVGEAGSYQSVVEGRPALDEEKFYTVIFFQVLQSQCQVHAPIILYRDFDRAGRFAERRPSTFWH